MKNAKEVDSLAKQFKTYHVDDPAYQQLLIDDAIGAMKEKLEKYGTSQDPSEWTDPPEYSNPTEHKGFVMVIVFYKNKYKGLAKEMDTGHTELYSDWFGDKNSAGKQIIKYVDLFRKQANMQHLDAMNAKRNRAKERSKLILN